MLSKTLRGTALAAALAASSLPALPVSAQAAPWGWHRGWGWGGWGWGGFGVGLAAGLIGSALAAPFWGYPAYAYYPAYSYGYGYPHYRGYYAPRYYRYRYARAYWAPRRHVYVRHVYRHY